jgi:hypothetical protein
VQSSKILTAILCLMTVLVIAAYVIAAWVRNGGDPSRLEVRLKEFERAMELATSEWEIYYLRSTDGGSTWDGPTRLA